MAPQAQQTRSSMETDRRHLLSDVFSPSGTTSIASSIYDGDRTPRATSPVRASRVSDQAHLTRHASIASPEQAHAQASYRGFSSEQAYLDALKAWAEGKKYDAPSNTALIGFYGDTTMEELAAKPPAFQGLGLRKKWRARKARTAEASKPSAERRATVV